MVVGKGDNPEHIGKQDPTPSAFGDITILSLLSRKVSNTISHPHPEQPCYPLLTHDHHPQTQTNPQRLKPTKAPPLCMYQDLNIPSRHAPPEYTPPTTSHHIVAFLTTPSAPLTSSGRISSGLR